MSNRIIKDSIWSSPSLAKLPIDAQLHWPRLLLMADDWGCFNADLDVILGLVYPKMKGMSLKKVEALLQTYIEAGMLFIWQDGERSWGYFTSWNGHQFCNGTNLDDDGKQQRHRRKTPEPPEKELQEYLNVYLYKKQVVSGKLEQFSTGGNISINPIPIPIPIPIPNPNPNPSLSRFDEFWDLYPSRNGRKVGKEETKTEFLKVNIQAFELLIIATKNYAQSRTAQDGYAKDPIRFLRKDFWKEWIESEAPQVAPSKPSSMDKTLSALDEARLLVESRERQKVLGEGL